jgi:hypothetical protein
MVRRRVLWKSAAARRLLDIAGNPSTVEAAVRIVAKWVLQGVSCPPTDLDAISSRLDIVGFHPEEMSVAGELRRDGKGFKVVYSSSLLPERRRFTIAHEMGHAVFEASGRNCPRTGAELERLCDLLATEILMPSDVFLSLLGEKLSLQKIFELAKTFKTSLSATAIRCSELRRISVFEVENGNILWSRGVVRKVESALKPTVDRVLLGHAIDETIYMSKEFWTGEWQIEGVPIGRGNRAIFLLQPVPASGRQEVTNRRLEDSRCTSSAQE